jgi:hypothetical protein
LTGSLRTMEMSSTWRNSWGTCWNLSGVDYSHQALGMNRVAGLGLTLTLKDLEEQTDGLALNF